MTSCDLFMLVFLVTFFLPVLATSRREDSAKCWELRLKNRNLFFFKSCRDSTEFPTQSHNRGEDRWRPRQQADQQMRRRSSPKCDQNVSTPLPLAGGIFSAARSKVVNNSRGSLPSPPTPSTFDGPTAWEIESCYRVVMEYLNLLRGGNITGGALVYTRPRSRWRRPIEIARPTLTTGDQLKCRTGPADPRVVRALMDNFSNRFLKPRRRVG